MPRRIFNAQEWLPDIQKTENPGVEIARNVLPVVDGYQLANGWEPLYAPLGITSKVNGFFAIAGPDIEPYTPGAGSDPRVRQINYLAGTETTLYHLELFPPDFRVGQWQPLDITTAMAPPNAWWFVSYGQYVFFISGDTQGVPGVRSWNAVLKGSTSPVAEAPEYFTTLAMVRNHLVGGGSFIDTGGGSDVIHRVQWSDVRNPFSWAPGAPSLANEQDIDNEGGTIQAIIGGEYGLVFQDSAITRMDPSTQFTFTFNTVAKDQGTGAPKSVVRSGKDVFFLGKGGFYGMSDGTTPQSISDGKISRYIRRAFENYRIDMCVGAYDQQNRQIWWGFPPADDGVIDTAIVYSLEHNKFSELELDCDFIAPCVQNLANTTQLGVNEICMFDTSHVFNARDDLNTMAKGLIQFPEAALAGVERRSRVTRVTPIGNIWRNNLNEAHMVSARIRDDAVEVAVDTPEKPLNELGRAYLDVGARYHSARIKLTEGLFTTAERPSVKGIQLEFEDMGER